MDSRRDDHRRPRDHEPLALVDELHRETLTQSKWLETQVKQASPQALVVGSGS